MQNLAEAKPTHYHFTSTLPDGRVIADTVSRQYVPAHIVTTLEEPLPAQLGSLGLVYASCMTLVFTDGRVTTWTKIRPNTAPPR